MKKVAALLLAAGLMLCLLTACGGISKASALHGQWSAEKAIDASTVTDKLLKLEFKQKEIDLIKNAEPDVVTTLTFREDGRYEFAYDKAASQKNVRAFFGSFLETLYRNRDKLTDLYGKDIKECESADEFKALYAYIFGYDTYEQLLSAVTDFLVDPDMLDKPTEHGTFEVKDGVLYLTPSDSENAQETEATLRGNALTLRYKSDVRVTYRLTDDDPA